MGNSRSNSVFGFYLVLFLITSLTMTISVRAQTINDFVSEDGLEKASIQSVADFNLPSFYKINDLKVVSPFSFALVGSYVNPNDEAETQRAWFGIYENNKLISQFDLGGEYWLQEDGPLVFRNAEFIATDYQLGYFYVVGNAEVLGLTNTNSYVNTSIEFSFLKDDMKVNFANIRINPYTKALGAVALSENYVVNGTVESRRIDFYSARTTLQGGNYKNTKIGIIQRNLELNTFSRLGPFVMDRPLDNNSAAFSFFSTPFGPMALMSDFEGDLQVHTFFSISHKINPLGRISDFYTLELDTVGFEQSMVSAELGFTNNSLVLNLNSYSYDFGKTLWASNIWENVTDIEFKLDTHNNSVFLSSSAVNSFGITLLNVMHFDTHGKLKSEVNLGHHTLVTSFFVNNKLSLITKLDGEYKFITIKIESISVLSQFAANLLKVFQKSTLVNVFGIVLFALLTIHETRKRLEKADSAELYPEADILNLE